MTPKPSRDNLKVGPRRLVLLLEEPESIWSAEAKAEVLAAIADVQEGLGQAGYQVVRIQIENPRALPELLKPFDPCSCVVFNWYEGVEGSARDCIQVAAQLERLGYIYTGADAPALQTAQNKLVTKRRLKARGVPTPVWQPVSQDNLQQWTRYPAIVKVANEHGSECLTDQSVVHDEGELYERVAELGATSTRQLMVSEFIEGRELTAAVWGNGNLQVLPLVEIDFDEFPAHWPRLRTYDAKWEAQTEAYGRIRLVCPPRLPRTLQARVENIAREAYRACQLRDYGRIDMRLRGDEPQVIDVNANPDITADSSFVVAAQRAGCDYGAMLAHIVQLAVQRAEAK
jgi:D-alanine-D-alanine ligase